MRIKENINYTKRLKWDDKMIESNEELDFIIKMATDNIINRLFKLGTVFDFQKFIIKQGWIRNVSENIQAIKEIEKILITRLIVSKNIYV